MKTIYFEPIWKMHSFYYDLTSFPPSGYKFLAPCHQRVLKAASNSPTNYFIFEKVNHFLPLFLAKTLANGVKRPKDVDLTFAQSHLVLRKEPWIADATETSLYFIGSTVEQFKAFKSFFQKALESNYCKKIICWFDVVAKTFSLNFESEIIESKLEVVRPAIRKKQSTKPPVSDTVKLLFVGSGNMPNISKSFEKKGGKEALLAFLKLNTIYKNLEFVIRCQVPDYIRRICSKLPNVRLIEKPVSWSILEKEFISADIFFLPTLITPSTVFLDAMRYELPIVTTDDWANAELVDDGRTGFLAHRESVCLYKGVFVPPWNIPAFWKNYLEKPDIKAIEGLVDKISLLIEDEKMRRRIGKEARRDIEVGRFSIQQRNRHLKRIFDESILEI